MRSINLGRWSRRVERYFNMKGGSGLLDVEQSIRVILPIASGVEERYLEGWNRFAVQAFVAAVAANNGRVRIRNPVGSNVITVLEQIVVSLSATTDQPIVTWGAASTDLASLANVAFSRMDPRGNPTPTSIVSFNAQATGGLVLLQRAGSTNGTIDFINNPNQEIPNLPGQAIDVQSNAANQALTVSFMWRERALENSELT